ncbi:MAG: putative 4-hydroxybenzoate polyprenyltransferase [Eubacteriales bacterium]|nr:putative 4-hydroxybenzoate polyprenyltransferase [Eubacteriales bacterium]
MACRDQTGDGDIMPITGNRLLKTGKNPGENPGENPGKKSAGADSPLWILAQKIKAYGKLVMFGHTIFSFSFAAVAAALAAKGMPALSKLIWIMVCFLAARTGANAANRLIDAEIDALNPRTAGRQIPKGEIRKKEVFILAAMCFIIMLFGAYMLNWICFALSPLALFLLVFYSYTKRFTTLCHIILGATCACAPVGAYLAVTGRIALTPVIMGIANMLWVAGFDIIYAIQDIEFDRANRLYSIPAASGFRKSVLIAAVFHTLTAALLFLLGTMEPLFGPLYYGGVTVITVLLSTEYIIVLRGGNEKINTAAYGINQIVSVVLLVTGLADIFL